MTIILCPFIQRRVYQSLLTHTYWRQYFSRENSHMIRLLHYLTRSITLKNLELDEKSRKLL